MTLPVLQTRGAAVRGGVLDFSASVAAVCVRFVLGAALVVGSLGAFAPLASAQGPASGKPAAATQAKGTLKFEHTHHKFGDVEAGSKNTFEFFFTNNSTFPVTITNASASCGCTSPEWKKTPIAPGERSSIRTTFNATGAHGQFSKSVQVTTDGEPAMYALAISGTIVPGPESPEERYTVRQGSVGFEEEPTSFGSALNHTHPVMVAHGYNFSEKPMRVLGIEAPGYIKATPDGDMVQGRSTFSIKLELNPMEGGGVYGDFVDMLTLRTDDPDQPDKTFEVNGTVNENFDKMTAEDKKNAPKLVATTDTIRLGTLKMGQSVPLAYTIKNKGKNPLLVRKVEVSCGCTKASAASNTIKKNKSTVINATFLAEAPGQFSKYITVISNDPAMPRKKLVLMGTVQ